MLSANQYDRPRGPTATSKLLQRQQNNPWIPSIFRYVFPRNAFQRFDQWGATPPHFSFPTSPNRPDCLNADCLNPVNMARGRGAQQVRMEYDDPVDAIIPSDITEILNSIVIPDEFAVSLPPPPLELDATRAIPGLDLSNDYLQSLNSDYMEHHRFGL